MSRPDPDASSAASGSALSEREKQVVSHAAQGFTDEMIAAALGISPGTVATYWSRVRMKLGLFGRTEIVAWFVRGTMTAESKQLHDENDRLIKQADAVEFLREMTDALFVTSVRQDELVAEASETEMALRNLFETVPMGIYVCDAQGAIVQFNRHTVGIWGRSPVLGVDRFCGSTKLFLPDGTAIAHEESPIAKVLHFGSAMLNVELAIERPDGSRVPVVMNFAPLKGKQQKINGAIASMVDLTERKAFEDALGESEARFRLMAEAMPQKISMADRLGALTYANPQWLDYTGLSMEQLRKDGWHDIIHPDDLAESSRRWSHSIESGEPFVTECRLRRQDGQYRWHLNRAMPVRNDAKQIVGWVRSSTDIDDARRQDESRRAHLEEEVDLRTAELLASNEELQGFTYSIAHDLRQQIRGISSNAAILILEASENLDEASLHRLHRLVDSSKKLARIVDDLLAYARLGQQEPNRDHFELSGLCNDIVSSLLEQGICRPGTQFSIAPGLVARGDVPLIRIVLENLLDNAIKYSAQIDAPFIEVGSEGDAFFVRDNGIGFEMQYERKLFQPFERLHGDSTYAGTGIGLANVKRIVEKHGGKVWAEGKLGIGATFYFTLG